MLFTWFIKMNFRAFQVLHLNRPDYVLDCTRYSLKPIDFSIPAIQDQRFGPWMWLSLKTCLQISNPMKIISQIKTHV